MLKKYQLRFSTPREQIKKLKNIIRTAVLET